MIPSGVKSLSFTVERCIYRAVIFWRCTLILQPLYPFQWYVTAVLSLLLILRIAERCNFDTIFIANGGIFENQGHIAAFPDGLRWLPMRKLLSRIKYFTIVGLVMWMEIITLLIGCFSMVLSLRCSK